jgi:hypothetical protein
MNRKLLGLLLALPVLAIARGGRADTPLSDLLACRHIAADAARLTCFDRVSAALARAPAASAPARASRQVVTQAMKEALDPQRTFGLPHATIVEREAAAAGVQVKDASNITARIVGLGHGPDGRAILTLDNGQVWEQLVADGTDLYTKPGDTVRISRGWLGSYWLEAPSHHGCKVTRLR